MLSPKCAYSVTFSTSRTRNTILKWYHDASTNSLETLLVYMYSYTYLTNTKEEKEFLPAGQFIQRSELILNEAYFSCKVL